MNPVLRVYIKCSTPGFNDWTATPMPLNMEFPKIATKQMLLETHPVFSALGDIDDLRVFMSWHVFAVWDFMCLVKRLQRELTSTQQVWLPPESHLASRLVNEIVLAEESDEIPGGGYSSHFELYLQAMQEIGANTGQIEHFISLLREGESVKSALERVSANPCIQNFVGKTMQTVIRGNVYQVLGSFLFGREHIIPEMFSSLLKKWHIDESQAPMLVYYLKRHIELDSDNHAPAAMKIINSLTKGNQHALRQLEVSAADAIDARINLWDGLADKLSIPPAAYSSPSP